MHGLDATIAGLTTVLRAAEGGGVVWIDGQIFVADAINNRIQVFSDQGEFGHAMQDKFHEEQPFVA